MQGLGVERAASTRAGNQDDEMAGEETDESDIMQRRVISLTQTNQIGVNPVPTNIYNATPKSFPCKFFHGVKGCHWGASCTFIHDEEWRGRRIPATEMQNVI